MTSEALAETILEELAKEGPQPYHRAHDRLLEGMLKFLIQGTDVFFLMPLERALSTRMRDERESFDPLFEDNKLFTARGGIYDAEK